jgi:two-component system, OmpR family, sensor histidine kinase BaeS
MNVINPDALIARTNVDRARSGAEIDFRYLGGLSDDAVPTLVESLPELDPTARKRLAENLLARRSDDDWRTWNWSRSRADALLNDKRLALLTMP